MSDAIHKVDVIFENVVKTTNDNRIKLIEDTIQYFVENNIDVTIDHYEFYLILDEAISNAMEHGNQWNIDRQVILQIYRPTDSKVEIRIKDEGKGFNPLSIPEKTNDIRSLSSRGRGIIIIKKFCDVFWNNTGNEIRLFLSIHDNAGARR